MSAKESQFTAGRNEGLKEGNEDGKTECLTWLERRYLKPDIDRRDPKAAAILEIATEMAKWIRSTQAGA